MFQNKNTKNPWQGHKSLQTFQHFKLYVLYEQAPKPIYLAALHLPNVRLCPCQAKTIKTITREASTKRGYATTKTKTKISWLTKTLKTPVKDISLCRLSQHSKIYVLYEQAPKPIYLAVLHLPNVRLCPCQAKTIKTITRERVRNVAMPLRKRKRSELRSPEHPKERKKTGSLFLAKTKDNSYGVLMAH